MREQYEEAKYIIVDIVTDYINDMEEIDGECEDREEILQALQLFQDLAEKALKD